MSLIGGRVQAWSEHCQRQRKIFDAILVRHNVLILVQARATLINQLYNVFREIASELM